MLVGTLLLDQNDNYLIEGRLPRRPFFDKAFLKALTTQQQLTEKGKELMPLSIRNVASRMGEPGLLVGIKEISDRAHLLIVTRSAEAGIGSKFRFDNFTLQVKTDKIELWVRKYCP